MLRIMFLLSVPAAAKKGGWLVITEMLGTSEPEDVVGSERSATDRDARCSEHD